jgi:hypothetical protein
MYNETNLKITTPADPKKLAAYRASKKKTKVVKKTKNKRKKITKNQAIFVADNITRKQLDWIE